MTYSPHLSLSLSLMSIFWSDSNIKSRHKVVSQKGKYDHNSINLKLSQPLSISQTILYRNRILSSNNITIKLSRWQREFSYTKMKDFSLRKFQSIHPPSPLPSSFLHDLPPSLTRIELPCTRLLARHWAAVSVYECTHVHACTCMYMYM